MAGRIETGHDVPTARDEIRLDDRAFLTRYGDAAQRGSRTST